MAESTVRAIEREVRTTLTEQENLQHEITSNKKALVDLEAKGTSKLEASAFPHSLPTSAKPTSLPLPGTIVHSTTHRRNEWNTDKTQKRANAERNRI